MISEVGVFRGSFDPPHKGHLETVRYALDTGLHRVIVVYTDPNPLKPFRSKDSMRKDLLKLLFKNYERVTITDNSYTACLAQLDSDPQIKKIYQIIAADLLTIPQRPVKLPTKLAYFILPRSNYELDKSMATLHNLPVKIANCAEFTERSHSSSQIRRLLLEKKFPDVYLSLPEDVIATIFQNNYYIPTANESAVDRFQQIKNSIEEEIARRKLVSLNRYPLTCHLGSDMGVHGLSGDQVCFVKDKDEQICLVVKVFLGNRASNYSSELIGLETIKNLNLEHVKVPEILFADSKEHFSYIGMSYIPGKTLAELMVDSPEAIKLCARANVALHTAKRVPAVISADQVLFYNKTFDAVCHKLTQLQPSHYNTDLIRKLENHWIKLQHSFVKNPGYFSYTHGDPNHYNWIVDLKNNSVTYIDLSLFARSVDAKREPCGLAVNEFEESLLTFRLAARRQGGISSEKLAEIKTLYETEYLKYAPANITTGEARYFFSAYWNLKIIESLIDKLLEPNEITSKLKYEKQLDEKIHSFLEGIWTL